jgi:hypothetical protein
MKTHITMSKYLPNLGRKLSTLVGFVLAFLTRSLKIGKHLIDISCRTQSLLDHLVQRIPEHSKRVTSSSTLLTNEIVSLPIDGPLLS